MLIFALIVLLRQILMSVKMMLSRNSNELIPAELCKYLHISQYLIHVSSDIFYEQGDNFSSEESNLNINNQYAAQKLNGEEVLKKLIHLF